MTLTSKLTYDHSRWQVSRVKQGTLTLPEHLFHHPLQGAIYSLSEIALSGAYTSKLASTYVLLFNRSVHVLYTEIVLGVH